MKQLLKNLFNEPDPVVRICTVLRPLGGGRYQVRDNPGRIFTVTVQGQESYQGGQGVRVTGDYITGPAGVVKQPVIYEV